MADKTGEQLSALVDGECEISEQQWMLRRLSSDNDLKARWQRYHLISDAVKNNLPSAVDARFADRIGEVIEAVPPPSQVDVSGPAGVSWFKPVTGFALAASVAAMGVIALHLIDIGEPGKPDALQPVAQKEQSESTRRSLDSRLNTYLVNHNEYASMNGVQGVMPYVRIVGIDARR
jgi:sigma-E factor negative regulatory protein RseA